MRTTWSVLAPKLNQDMRWVQNSIADPRDGGRGQGGKWQIYIVKF